MSTATSIVIFGASGDLARRKLIPALFVQYCKGRIPEHLHIVGTSRSKFTHEEFRERMRESILEFSKATFDAEKWAAFAPKLFYLAGDSTDADHFTALDSFLRDHEGGDGNRLYYLSTAPRFFAPIVDALGNANMVNEANGWRRVIIEKPFGHDLASAKALNASVHQVLDERQIYRIDHYLAKETVQNLLVLRFANAIFEPLWNRNFIDHIQITASETVDVGHRAGYYDTSGVMRDMVQNHLLQLLMLVAMEPPSSFEADAIRNEKVKVLAAVRPMTPSEIAARTVRAQYRGYSEAPGVAAGSETPTYAALKLFVDNWRWQGVPIYLRSGKALAEKQSEIIISFKSPPHLMFPIPNAAEIKQNVLAIRIQPDEGVYLRFEVKVPDTEADMRSVDMSFMYKDTFGSGALPEAYERLLLEALDGDASLFTRGDGIELAWGIVDPILSVWSDLHQPALSTYEPGSWGPAEADDLLARLGHRWNN